MAWVKSHDDDYTEGTATRDGDMTWELHPRARRVRAALPPQPYGGQLRGVPPPAPGSRPAAARRRLRPGHDHRRPRPAGLAGEVVALEINDEAAALTRAELDRRASTYAVGDVHALPRRRRVRRGARPPGAAARRRPGAGAARDGPRHPARGSGRGPRHRLRDVRVVRRGLRGSTDGSSCTPAPRAPTAASPTPAGACWPGRTPPVSTTSPPRPRRGASPPRRRERGGAGCGPTGSSARPSPSSWCARSAPLARSWSRISGAWRRWAADPDGWFSVHHGEVLCWI